MCLITYFIKILPFSLKQLCPQKENVSYVHVVVITVAVDV